MRRAYQAGRTAEGGYARASLASLLVRPGLGIGFAIWLLTAGTPVLSQTANRVALVIVHGSGSVVTRCVEFSEAQLSGQEVLLRAGLDLRVEGGGIGSAICRIDGEGCDTPRESCFCAMSGDQPRYWSYWKWASGRWEYSTRGASNSTVQNGDVEGWVWGLGTIGGGSPPPVVGFAQVCAAMTPTATATASPTASLTASPTGLPTAAVTSTPTSTPTPPPAPPTPTSVPTPTSNPATPLPPVATVAPPRIALFTAEPARTTPGGRVLLRWQVVDSIDVRLRGPQGDISVPPSAELWVQPLEMTDYVVLAQSAGGQVAQALRVEVDQPVSVQPASVQPALQLSQSTLVSAASPHALMLPLIQKSSLEPAIGAEPVTRFSDPGTSLSTSESGSVATAVPMAVIAPLALPLPTGESSAARPAVLLTPGLGARASLGAREIIAPSPLPGFRTLAAWGIAALGVLVVGVAVPLGMVAVMMFALFTSDPRR